MTDASIDLQDYLIARLRAASGLSELAEADQIRPESDMSDPPVGAFAVTVGVQDKGCHLGIPGRILVDIDATVELRASVTEDPDLTATRAISQAVFAAIEGIANDISMEGWTIRYHAPWVQSPLGVSDLYRFSTFTTTFLLQSNSSI